MKKQNSFLFKLQEIKKMKHYENDYEKFGLSEDDLKNINLKIGFGSEDNAEDESVSITLEICFVCSKDSEEYILCGIETMHTFKIKDFTKNILKENDRYVIPEEILATFLSISISDTRGMMFILNSNQIYKNLYLPIINPIDILTGKQKTLNEKQAK